MRVAAQREVGKIVERCTAACLVDLAGSRVATQNLCDLDIKQVRRMQGNARDEQLRRPLGRRRSSRRLGGNHVPFRL
jgi:hypothetical protein